MTTRRDREQSRSPVTADDPDAIHADLEAARADLNDTVAAVAARTDVKARAKDRAAAATGRVKDTAQQVGRRVRNRPVPAVAAVATVATVATVVGTVVVIRRRRPPMRTRAWHRLRRSR
jgi:anti-sigma-K factor RskA